MASSPKWVEGRNFPSQIEGVVQLASVHIAIFYKNYAQSCWCLDELDSMVKSRAPIIPIFYHVEPHPLPRFVDLGGWFIMAVDKLLLPLKVFGALV